MRELTPFGKNIWIVDGPDVLDAGLLFTTRMTVIKLTDGSMWIESPVTLPVETVEEIKSIGPVKYLVFRALGAAYPKGGVPLDIRVSFRNRVLARQSFEKLLSWDFDRLIIAHGACIETNAKEYIEEAFRWLSSSNRTTFPQQT